MLGVASAFAPGLAFMLPAAVLGGQMVQLASRRKNGIACVGFGEKSRTPDWWPGCGFECQLLAFAEIA